MTSAAAIFALICLQTITYVIVKRIGWSSSLELDDGIDVFRKKKGNMKNEKLTKKSFWTSNAQNNLKFLNFQNFMTSLTFSNPSTTTQKLEPKINIRFADMLQPHCRYPSRTYSTTGFHLFDTNSWVLDRPKYRINIWVPKNSSAYCRLGLIVCCLSQNYRVTYIKPSVLLFVLWNKGPVTHLDKGS